MRISIGLMVAALLAVVVAPAHALTEEEERAKAHFLAGQSYYDQASYSDALREFNEAYRLSKKPALLYNIARCDEALERYADAVSMLERYLAEAPSTPDRPAIETRIANLKQRQVEQDKRVSRFPSAPVEPSRPPPPGAVAAHPTTTTPPPAPPPRRKRVWTWIVGSIGVAALVGAAATGIESQITYNDLNSNCTGGVCDPTSVSGAQSKIDKGKKLALATDVLWPVGAVAVGAAVALFFIEGRHPTRHAWVVPMLGPGTGGLAVARRF